MVEIVHGYVTSADVCMVTQSPRKVYMLVPSKNQSFQGSRYFSFLIFGLKNMALRGQPCLSFCESSEKKVHTQKNPNDRDGAHTSVESMAFTTSNMICTMPNSTGANVLDEIFYNFWSQKRIRNVIFG